MNKILGTVLVALSAAILLIACSSKPVDEQVAGARTDERIDTGGAATTGLSGRGYTAADLNDPKSPLFQRVIYFDYDSSDIQPQFVDVLKAHASYLAGNRDLRIMLEGHTDERGTREYNLALGDQRADAVRRFLTAEGVAGGQLATLSYGEERHADPGHGESSWELNRRVELIY